MRAHSPAHVPANTLSMSVFFPHPDVQAGSPANRAGLRSGDKIVYINEHCVIGRSDKHKRSLLAAACAREASDTEGARVVVLTTMAPAYYTKLLRTHDKKALARSYG